MIFSMANAGVKPPRSGAATACSVAQSTLLMPRCGVGLNDLLGGGGCRYKPNLGKLTESRSGKARARTRELSAGCNRSGRVNGGKADDTNHCFRSRPTQRMRCVSAPNELDRRSNGPRTCPKSNANRSRRITVASTNPPNDFCRLTPELSRPVAGWRMRASVAQSTQLTPRHGVGLNDLLGCSAAMPSENDPKK